MNSSTKESLAQADIILNRTNVALARSQRLIASWLPPKDAASESQTATLTSQKNEDDEADFRGDSEIGGIGSAAQKDDSGLPDGAFKRRKLGANDKLLESLLGKKAANAHRKTQQQQGRAGLAQSTPRPAERQMQRPKPVQDDSDDEEGGRAAAFKSKKGKPSKPLARTERHEVEENAVSGGQVEDADDDATKSPSAASPPPPPAAAGKKRPASYLDELLAQKASKKSKKKKKAGDDVAAEA